MEDTFCSQPSERKPYSYWIYTFQTAKTPSQQAIPSIRLWKTQFLQGFQRNPLQ